MPQTIVTSTERKQVTTKPEESLIDLSSSTSVKKNSKQKLIAEEEKVLKDNMSVPQQSGVPQPGSQSQSLREVEGALPLDERSLKACELACSHTHIKASGVASYYLCARTYLMRFKDDLCLNRHFELLLCYAEI